MKNRRVPPYYIDMAVGDAATMYETEDISTVTVTDWDGAPVTGLTVVSDFFNSTVSLRISGGTASTTPYKLKVSVLTTPSGFKDEAFIELWVRFPTPSPVP